MSQQDGMKVIYNGWSWKELAVMTDPKSEYYGWLFGRHEDGQWVTLADLKQIDLAPQPPQQAEKEQSE